LSDPGEIERMLAAFARSANGGLIVTGSASALMHRDLIIKLAAQHGLPTVYYERGYVSAGGLISSTSSGGQRATSIASSRVRSQPTFPCRLRPSTSW
jgi:hypothetical protein